MRTESEKDQFFIIDRESLDEVRTRMYGYYLDENGITTNQSFDESKNIEPGRAGAYIVVRRSEQEITITQDYCGSYGLYLFEKDGYFALSNSFLCLVDYLKTRYPLTMDKDFADYLLICDFSPVAYGRTLIQEIRLLDRNAIVSIRLPDGKPEIRIDVPQIQTVLLDSEEGIRILDNWYDRWTGMLRSIASKTRNLTVDLSGGFDSRMTFLLAACSGIDLSSINIDSSTDGRHTHKEDFEIASEIAEHFGFTLNDTSMMNRHRKPIRPQEAIRLVFNVSLGFTKQTNFLRGRLDETRFRVTGAAGASIRDFWDMPVNEFLALQRERTNNLPKLAKAHFTRVQEDVLKESIAQVAAKYQITDLQSRELPWLLNKEERVRNHFGKDAVETWFDNDIKLMPLLDRDLNRLCACTMECPDKDLLIAVMFSRYCADLLKFKFDSGRCIAPETIEYAAKINAKYPMNARTAEDLNWERPDWSDQEPAGIPASTSGLVRQIEDIYWKWFNSDAFQRDFRLLEGAPVDRWMRKETLARNYNSLYHFYPSMAIVRMMRAVWMSRDGHGDGVIPDRPKTGAFSPELHVERRMLKARDWVRRNVVLKLRE